ncbi:MAG: hypothetical protein ABR928_14180 [Terracidiphilus sp.]
MIEKPASVRDSCYRATRHTESLAVTQDLRGAIELGFDFLSGQPLPLLLIEADQISGSRQADGPHAGVLAFLYVDNGVADLDAVGERVHIKHLRILHRHPRFIITSFRYPSGPAFQFADVCERLWRQGFAIYPGRLSHETCFRIGTIGRITTAEIEALLSAIGSVLKDMGVCANRGSDREPASARTP